MCGVSRSFITGSGDSTREVSGFSWFFSVYKKIDLDRLPLYTIKEDQTMGAKQLATKIDENIKDALDAFCEEKGLKINRFLEDAILDKLEEYEDVSDLRLLRKESFKSLDAVLKGLKLSGKL
jgi:hypothetical protein